MLKIAISILLFIIPATTFCQSAKDTNSIDLLKEIITFLSHDSLKGRAVGSMEEKIALRYIQSTFNSFSKKKLTIQKFSFQLDSSQINSENGYFFINNHKKQTIVLSAHCDHIGLGGKLSLSAKKDEVHNGADDNASGVALLLALSEKLLSNNKANYNYVIVFYSAHEVGLFGSEAFKMILTNNKKKFKKIKLAINFDMVGRMDPELKKFNCYTSSDSLFKEVEKNSAINLEFNLNILTNLDKLALLDTHIFIENNTSCMNFTSGIHIDYHATSDDEKYINYEGIELLLKFLYSFII